MSNKSWVAMTGLWVLMATSAAQAHLIPICVEAHEADIQVGGAVDGVTRSVVTFTEAGWQTKPLAAVETHPDAQCVPQAAAAKSKVRRTVAQGVGAGAGILLPPLTLPPATELSLDSATDVAGLDATEQSQSSLDGAGGLLASTSTFGRSFGGYGVRRTAANGHSIRALADASEQATSGAQSVRPSVAAGTSHEFNGANSNGPSGNIGNAPVAGNSPGGMDSGRTPVIRVPEPGTLALLMMGVLGIACSGRRRRAFVRTA